MNLLLGKQAILNREQKIVAYELLFRSSDNAPIDCDTEATANVVSNILSMFTNDNILGNKRGFINIGIDILRKGLLELLPAKKFVIEILETQEPNEELLQFIKKLKKKDYIFALDDFIISDEQIKYWDPILKEVQIVKVDVLDTSLEKLKEKTELLKSYNIALLAEKVETKEMFELCYDLGYTFFQGYFFTKPEIIEGQGFEPSIQGILQIIRLLQADANIEKIEQTMKIYPDLIISLLKIANSSSVSPIQEITSIKQTIALLGTKALSQWLLLMLYSNRRKHQEDFSLKSDPLFLTATQRGKMMESLIKSTSKKVSRSITDEAFLVGLLSLSDALLHIPLPKIIEELHMADSIASALLLHTGLIGEILNLVKAFEQNDLSTVNNTLQKYSISHDILTQASYTALQFSKQLAGEL